MTWLFEKQKVAQCVLPRPFLNTPMSWRTHKLLPRCAALRVHERHPSLMQQPLILYSNRTQALRSIAQCRDELLANVSRLGFAITAETTQRATRTRRALVKLGRT